MMAQWVGVQGREKVAKKSKTPPLVAVPQENPKPKTKNFFFRFRIEDFLNPERV